MLAGAAGAACDASATRVTALGVAEATTIVRSSGAAGITTSLTVFAAAVTGAGETEVPEPAPNQNMPSTPITAIEAARPALPSGTAQRDQALEERPDEPADRWPDDSPREIAAATFGASRRPAICSLRIAAPISP
jgi:hypothetical protein